MGGAGGHGVGAWDGPGTAPTVEGTPPAPGGVTPAVVERFAAECGVTLRPGAAWAIAALMAPDPGPPWPVGTVLVPADPADPRVWTVAHPDYGDPDEANLLEADPRVGDYYWVRASHPPEGVLTLHRGPVAT
jgi:hypothetical protein